MWSMSVPRGVALVLATFALALDLRAHATLTPALDLADLTRESTAAVADGAAPTGPTKMA
jgi:hypothetical protein